MVADASFLIRDPERLLATRYGGNGERTPYDQRQVPRPERSDWPEPSLLGVGYFLAGRGNDWPEAWFSNVTVPGVRVIL